MEQSVLQALSVLIAQLNTFAEHTGQVQPLVLDMVGQYWPIVSNVLIGILAFFLLAHLPIIPIIRILMLPVPDKANCIACFLKVWVKSLLVIIPDLLAPIVVPIALMFTKWEDEKLPALFSWWDNDASINGDVRTDDSTDGFGGWGLRKVPLEDTPEARAMCYWTKGKHPRSFYARYIWLGWRNRASNMSVMLGVDKDLVDIEWATEAGDVNAPTHTGYKIQRAGDHWRYFEVIKFGPIFFRFHYGYKIPRIPGTSKAMFTAIGFQFQKAK